MQPERHERTVGEPHLVLRRWDSPSTGRAKSFRAPLESPALGCAFPSAELAQRPFPRVRSHYSAEVANSLIVITFLSKSPAAVPSALNCCVGRASEFASSLPPFFKPRGAKVQVPPPGFSRSSTHPASLFLVSQVHRGGRDAHQAELIIAAPGQWHLESSLGARPDPPYTVSFQEPSVSSTFERCLSPARPSRCVFASSHLPSSF